MVAAAAQTVRSTVPAHPPRSAAQPRRPAPHTNAQRRWIAHRCRAVASQQQGLAAAQHMASAAAVAADPVALQELVEDAVVWASQHGLVRVLGRVIYRLMGGAWVGWSWPVTLASDGVATVHLPLGARPSTEADRHSRIVDKVLALCHRLQLVGLGIDDPACAAVHAPLALLPVPYPRETFEQVHAVSARQARWLSDQAAPQPVHHCGPIRIHARRCHTLFRPPLLALYRRPSRLRWRSTP